MVVCTALVWSVAGGVLMACEDGDDSAPASMPNEAGSDAASGDGAKGTDAGEAGAAEEAGLDAAGADSWADADDAMAVADAALEADVAPEAAAGDAAVPTRLLLSNNASQSELVAFDVTTGQVDGRLVYPSFIGTTAIGPDAPWLLEQAVDVVARLDPAEPWKVTSSWNVALDDAIDGGDSYSDPDAVVVGAGSKAYVLRYTRNEIAVLDAAAPADGGVPVKAIDLSGQLQAAGDGIVEMSAGVYVPGKQLVYVVLANINRGNVANNGYTLLCSDTHPTVIAIDVNTDTLVDLNGAAAGVGLALTGYDPGMGQGSLAYDAASDRLLVVETGCNQVDDAGGMGPLVGREIEELSLFTGQSRTLVDLDAAGFPSDLVYIDAHRALVQLDFSGAYAWDPTMSALGPAVPNAPDNFAWDGVANLVGIRARYDADGGSGTDVISVRMADGKVTLLGQDPFSLSGGYPSGAQLWPAP
jgi:hypothetical protein